MRLAFWGLLAIGFGACTAFGIGPVLARVGGNWMSPWMLSGSALGVTILALAAAFAAGVRPTPLATDRSMLIALAVLIGAKVAIAGAQMALAATARG